MDISKVVIPAAGRGTRFLPLSKSVPKEMLPLLEKPAIQYLLEEGIHSALRNFILITSREKHTIENYLDTDPGLELYLKESAKNGLTHDLDAIIKQSELTYIRQHEPLGLGHAVWLARHCIQKEYFGVALPDDIIVDKQPALDQLIRIARQEKASVIAIQEVPAECLSSYGIIEVKKQITPNLFQVQGLVEKPAQKDAPSNLAVIGRYVLSSKVFASLEHVRNYSLEEVQLTDAISHMIQNNEKVFAYKVQGIRYDIGTPLGWLKATIGLALDHPHYGHHIKRFIADSETVESYRYNKSKNIEHII